MARAGFIVAGNRHAGVEIAGGQLAQAGGQLLNGLADAMGEVDHERHRAQPEDGGQEKVDQRQAAAEIVPAGPFDGVASIDDLPGDAVQGHGAQAFGIDADGAVAAGQIVQAVAAVASQNEAVGVLAGGKIFHRLGPIRLFGKREFPRLGVAGLGAQAEIVAGIAIQLLAGLLQGPGD